MTVDRAKLEQTLADLHGQLMEIDEIDPEIRDRLRITLDEIHTVLTARQTGAIGAVSAGNNLAANATGRPISTRLREAAEHFEGSHPRLSATLGSVVEALSRMGV